MDYKIMPPFGNDICAELQDRLNSRWVKHGLNALARSLEYENNWHIHYEETADLDRAQSRVSQFERSSLVTIQISAELGSGKNEVDKQLLRFLLAHELGHLAFKHYEFVELILEHGKWPGEIETIKTYSDINDFILDLEAEATAFAIAVLMRYNYVFERYELPRETLDHVVHEWAESESVPFTEEKVEEIVRHVEESDPETPASLHLMDVMQRYLKTNQTINIYDSACFMKDIECIQKDYRTTRRSFN